MPGPSAHGQKNKKHKTGKHESKGQRHKHREQKSGKHILNVKSGGSSGKYSGRGFGLRIFSRRRAFLARTRYSCRFSCCISSAILTTDPFSRRNKTQVPLFGPSASPPPRSSGTSAGRTRCSSAARV